MNGRSDQLAGPIHPKRKYGNTSRGAATCKGTSAVALRHCARLTGAPPSPVYCRLELPSRRPTGMPTASCQSPGPIVDQNRGLEWQLICKRHRWAPAVKPSQSSFAVTSIDLCSASSAMLPRTPHPRRNPSRNRVVVEAPIPSDPESPRLSTIRWRCRGGKSEVIERLEVRYAVCAAADRGMDGRGPSLLAARPRANQTDAVEAHSRAWGRGHSFAECSS